MTGRCPTPYKASWPTPDLAHAATLMVPGTAAYRCLGCALWHLRNAEARRLARNKSKREQRRRNAARRWSATAQEIS